MTDKPFLCMIGVDPGLVHTGVVGIGFDPNERFYHTWYEVVNGLDAAAVKKACACWPDAPVVIEAYRPRSHFGQDKGMIRGIHDMRTALGGRARTLNNTGVKKIVTDNLMKALGVWTFDMSTHHDDLRSAARICLYAMLKDKQFNQILRDYLSSFEFTDPWIRI